MISEIVLVKLWRQETDSWAGVSNAVQQILSCCQSGEIIQIPGFITWFES